MPHVTGNSVLIEHFEEIFSLDENSPQNRAKLYYLCLSIFRLIFTNDSREIDNYLKLKQNDYLTLTAQIYGMSDYESIVVDKYLVLTITKK